MYPSIGVRVCGAGRSRMTCGPMPTGHLVALMAGVLLAGIYGGYFGAAQGVILIGLLSALSTFWTERLEPKRMAWIASHSR